MKLHLPKPLWVALTGLASVTSPFALTVTTASSAVALFGVASAADVLVELDKTTPTQDTVPSISAGDTLTVRVAEKLADEEWQANWKVQVKQNVTSIVTVGANATLNVGPISNSSVPGNAVFTQGQGKTQTINLGENSTMNTSRSLAGWTNDISITVVNMAAGSTWNSETEYMNQTTINMGGGTINVNAGAVLNVERQTDSHQNTIRTLSSSTETSVITSRSGDGTLGNGAIRLQNWNLNLDVIAGSFHGEGNTDADLRIEVAILATNGGYSYKKIIKTGNGLLELTNADSTYDGGTDVSAGTLRLAGLEGNAGVGTINVDAGATLELAHTQSCTTDNAIGIGVGGNLIVAGEGTETVTNAITGSAALSLTKGSLSLTGTEAHFASMSIAEGTTLSTSAQTNLYIGSTIENGGTLNIGGAIYVANVTGLTPAETVVYTDGENGFMRATYRVYQGGSATVGEGVKVHIGDSTYDLTDNGTIVGDSTSGGRYYVNTDLTYGSEGNHATGENVHSLVLGTGVTLTLATGLKSYTVGEGNSATEQQVNIIANGNATISLNSGVSLNRESLVTFDGAETHTVTLAGAGTYVAGNEAWTSGNTNSRSVQLGDNWTGVVELSGELFMEGGLNIDNYANNASKVCLVGVTSWLKDGEYTSALILGNGDESSAGLTLSSMSDKTYHFSGRVSGKGIFETANEGSDKSPVFRFSGDVSAWEGMFKSTGNALASSSSERVRTLKFTDSATQINADIENAGTAKLSVMIENSQAVQINSTISNTAGGSLKLTTSGTGTKTFSGAVNAGSLVATGGDVVFSGTLNLNGEASTIAGNATFGDRTTLDANLTVGGRTTLSGGNASIAIGGGVTFVTGNETITKLQQNTDTTISGTGVVSVGTAGIIYTNADITVDIVGNLATAATLNGSKLTVRGGGSATSKVGADSVNSFDASQGSVIVDTGSDDIAKVRDLTVGSDKSASFTRTDGVASTAEISGTASLAATSSVSGNLKIANGATLRLESATSAGGGSDIVRVDGKVTFENGSSLSLLNKVDVSGITTDTDYVLAWAAGGFEWAAELSLNDVILAGTLEQGMQAALVAVNVDSPATSAISREVAQQSAAQQLLLRITAPTPTDLVATSVVGYNAEGKVLTIGVGEALADISGNLSVTISDEMWKAIVGDMGQDINEPVSVILSGSDNVPLDLTRYAGTVALNGYTGTETKGVYVMSNVPEPATATLSLLALAALAARRRRKHA